MMKKCIHKQFYGLQRICIQLLYVVLGVKIIKHYEKITKGTLVDTILKQNISLQLYKNQLIKFVDKQIVFNFFYLEYSL